MDATWGRWGTPYLEEQKDTPVPAVVSSPTDLRPLSPEAIRRAIHAEEQRQVFALLGRLRRSRLG
ncbi:hypothetical protein GCM10008956_00940 [Deinococcus arenae]|uniref:Uncharacterized protein n=3 Tax=Deinococcaceae TaxID=183710 RepID=A0A8H9L4X9_9DEIO|nr:hypothetical protein AUC44_11095 [Deinococcus actinosclerus]AWT36149.1 hypothetical protein DM785_11715 [Deinococcus actinosclerus]GGM28790.1 hypothetical protein GCM10008956_00940 [Deinococcus arenae]